MADFLIKATNNWMVDADKIGWTAEQISNADTQYKKGDIVQVFPDGKLSDHAHANGKFYVIRIVGLAYKEALKYQESQWEDYIAIDDETHKRIVKRRLFRIRIEDLPVSVRTTLENTFVYNTTWTELKSYIYNKVTEANET